MEQHARVRAVFDSDLKILPVAEREAYLDQACADDPDVRQAVETLLKADEEGGSFLERPTVPPPDDRYGPRLAKHSEL